MIEPEPLQQVDRTYVRFQGRKLSYFSGCDYLRLASHPEVITALEQGARKYGLNVAASRMTSGNHRLYGELEARLARFFDAPSALLVPSGYVTNLIVTQALAGNFSHLLIDERAHASLQDAARLLECPILRFQHRNPEDLARCVERCGPGAKLILLTDGLFAHDGSVAPLRAYLEVLPGDALLLVDDAHGAGILGKTGQGSLQYAGVRRQHVIQTITLSKAFGTFGGVIVGSQALRRQILDRSLMFTGGTPLPLPLVNAAIKAVRIVETNPALRKRLIQNSTRVKDALERAGFSHPKTPGPVISVAPPKPGEAERFRRRVLRAGIFTYALKYPSHSSAPYFRFAISSEHTPEQLDKLSRTLIEAGLARW